MPGFIDQLESTKVTVASPDGSVIAKYDVRGGTVIEFGPRGTQGHTEQSLAAEVTAALRGVTKGFARAARSLTSPYRSSADVAPGAPQARRRQMYHAAVGGIDVRVTSPGRFAKVRMSSEGTEVRIRPQVLGRMDVSDERLAGEINAAVAQAHDQFGAERIKLRREYYSADSMRKKGLVTWLAKRR